ncbi:MAG TPA: uridine diphosphate-N-acetylglucosamine-binding protein YvcK [Iamia sp.]
MNGLIDGGPAIACVGGGHGLSATLRAARTIAGELTAIVSVADDGGSSGRLRDDLGILPPGDLRRCLSALAASDSVLGRALEHRFDQGELKEHAVGNLLLAGLIDHGVPVEDALAEVATLVGAVGSVLPAATVPVMLSGRGNRSGFVEGQVQVQEAQGVDQVEIRPADPPTPQAAVDALLAADLVTLGPGSLFTSVLAATIVPGVARALAATAATRVLVLNLGPQARETEHLGPDDHVRLARDHGAAFDVVLADPRFAPSATDDGVEVVVRPVGADHGAVHDPTRLAAALSDLLRRG